MDIFNDTWMDLNGDAACASNVAIGAQRENLLSFTQEVWLSKERKTPQFHTGNGA